MVIFKLVTSFLNLLANNFYMIKMAPLWNFENKLDLTSIGALGHYRLG